MAVVPGAPAAGTEAELLNRRAAFDVFDVEHDGCISVFELSSALMACDDVRAAVTAHSKRELRAAEVQSALDCAGAAGASVVTFQEFLRVCDSVRHSVAHRRAAEEQRAAMRAREEAAEQQNARAGAPVSPRGPRPLLWSQEEHPELGTIQRAFYTFDVDCSGLVSAHEVPRMLRLVGVGPKRDDDWKRYDRKWRDALADLWPPKDPSDLLNVHDFHELCLQLNPSLQRELPERPRPPPPADPRDPSPEPTAQEPTPEELAEMERLRREEEEREALRRRQNTLHVRMPDGSVVPVPEVAPDDRVSAVMQRVEAVTRVPEREQRLLCHGYEMNRLQPLSAYKVRCGHPILDKADIAVMLLRQPTPEPRPQGGELGPLFVRTARGDTWQVLARDEDSVGDVMTRLQEQSGVPIGVQRLVGLGRELAPWERLRDAGIGSGDTLVLLPR